MNTPVPTWRYKMWRDLRGLWSNVSWIWVCIIILFVSSWVRIFVYYDERHEQDERISYLEYKVAELGAQNETP